MLQRLLTATSISGAVAFYAFKKRKLTPRASVTAFLVGTIIGLSGAAPNASLLAFFLSASKITGLGKERKLAMSEKGAYDSAGNRNVSQVLSNSAAAVAIIFFDYYYMITAKKQMEQNTNDNFLMNLLMSPSSLACRLAVVYHFAGTNGDTFSSEIGVLSKSKPRLILNPFKEVPAGTNGGVTLLGLGAAAVGGLVVGIASFGAEMFLQQHGNSRESTPETAKKFILGSVVAAVGCSVLDSILGASLQYSGESSERENKNDDDVVVVTEDASKSKRRIAGFLNLLNNDQVNLVSAFVVTAISYNYFSK